MRPRRRLVGAHPRAEARGAAHPADREVRGPGPAERARGLAIRNVDAETVRSFGEEWTHFDQNDLSPAERRQHFDAYFDVFPWAELPPAAVGFDAGCGSGRWAAEVAPRVGFLHCIDASEQAAAVARRTLADRENVAVHVASVADMPLQDGSMDFGYSLGVLHHTPDTAGGLRDCVAKLKPAAPFLVYLYYGFDDRPAWFRALWRASDAVRRVVARLPHRAKVAVTSVIAVAVYLPLSRAARLVERAGADVDGFPLSIYRNRSFYSIRTDALDRFGTRVEHRFTAPEIRAMMEAAGLRDIVFSQTPPYWCAVGRRQ